MPSPLPIVLLGIAIGAPDVDAEGARVRERLSWRAPPDCPTEVEVEDAVCALHDRAAPLEREVRARVRFEDGRWRVLFDVFADERRLGGRRLDLEGDCRGGLETLAFVATLLLEGGSLDRSVDEEAPPADAVADPPLPSSRALELDGQSFELAPPDFSGSAFVGAGFRPTLLPALGASLEIGGALVYRKRLSVGAVGSLFAAEGVSGVDGAGSVATGGGGGRFEACGEAGEGFRFGACGGVALFAIEARGLGFPETRREWVTVPAVFAAFRFGWLFGTSGLFVRGDAGVGASLERYAFVTAQGRALFSQPEFFPWLVLGAGRLW